MLGRLLGSVNKERVLAYLEQRERGHAREIARFFEAPLSPIQKALDQLEAAGVLVSREIGTARVYEFSPRYPAGAELRALIGKAVQFYPPALRDRLRPSRTRPRRRGKPL